MPGEQIQWFPGHMAKTRRLIAENAKNVHLFIEVLDARVPVSSRNPVLPELTGGKPVLLLLNKASLADPDKSRVFMRAYTDADTAACLPSVWSGTKRRGRPVAICAQWSSAFPTRGNPRLSTV